MGNGIAFRLVKRADKRRAAQVESIAMHISLKFTAWSNLMKHSNEIFYPCDMKIYCVYCCLTAQIQHRTDHPTNACNTYQCFENSINALQLCIPEIDSMMHSQSVMLNQIIWNIHRKEMGRIDFWYRTLWKYFFFAIMLHHKYCHCRHILPHW